MACPHVGWAPAAALGITGGSAAVDGEGLAYDGGAESADRPGAAGGCGVHGGQAAYGARAGGWDLFPGGAVPAQEGADSRARGWAGHARPRAAVPVQDQGLGGTGAGKAHRPGAAGGGGGHAGQVVAGSRAGAGYARPRGAVPVQDQGLVTEGGANLTGRPGVAGGGGGHVGQEAERTDVWAGYLFPSGAVPVQDQG